MPVGGTALPLLPVGREETGAGAEELGADAAPEAEVAVPVAPVAEGTLGSAGLPQAS